jgi:phage shock protein A
MVVVTDLQTKVEKYEARATRCQEQAQAAIDKAQQNFYEVLAGYYSGLATDFRKIIEKRTVA